MQSLKTREAVLSNPGPMCLAAVLTGSATAAMAQPSVVLTPPVVTIGSIVTLEVSPHTPGYELHDGVKIQWSGVYRFPDQSVSDPIVFDFDFNDIRITSDWTAEVVIGQGLSDLANPLPDLWPSGGALEGTVQITSDSNPCAGDRTGDGAVTHADMLDFLIDADPATYDPSVEYLPGYPPMVLNFQAFMTYYELGCLPADFVLSGPANMSINADIAEWRPLHYSDAFGSSTLPTFGEAATTLDVMGVPAAVPWNPTQQQLASATYSHYCLIFPVKANEYTAADAIGYFFVDIVSYDANGVYVDLIPALELNYDSTMDDGEYLYFRTSRVTPFVFSTEEHELGDPDFNANVEAPFILLQVPDGGRVVVAPSYQ